MKRTLLKSKIHRAVVTDKNVEYEGSITVDSELMRRADLVPYERVDIYNVKNGERFSTYVITGRPGGGQVVVNGAAARKVETGDVLIVASYAEYQESEIQDHHPKLVYVNAHNEPVEKGNVVPLGPSADRQAGRSSG